MSNSVELCYWYSNDGYPNFSPIWDRGRKASLDCRSIRHDCTDYKNSNSPKGPRFENSLRRDDA